MKKKGFTLIELLAVIVILAIIALITVPLILNVIDTAKRGSFKDTAYGLIESAELYYSKQQLSGNNLTSKTFTFPNASELGYKGETPKSGSLVINQRGQVSLAISNDKYCIKKSFDETEVTMDEDLEECIIEGADYVDNSGANQPDLLKNMIPIMYDGENWVYAKTSQAWYNYDNKEWANAVVLNSGVTKKKGDPISEDEIALWYVWVPRYKYKLFNANNKGVEEQLIDVVFETGTETTGTVTCIIASNGVETCQNAENGNWYTHPAFTLGTQQLEGIWVGKFEISTADETCNSSASTTNCNKELPVTIKPNVSSWRYASIENFYYSIQKIPSTYLISNGDSHMIKNIEWGTITYLKQSQYGLGITDLTFSDNYHITGGETSNFYKTNIGQSTTGNVYGIYDMNGGAYEMVMGLELTSNESIYIPGFSDLNKRVESKYYDSYVRHDSCDGSYARSHLGDATRETVKYTTGTNLVGWYNHSIRTFCSQPVISRGGFREGLFYSYETHGIGDSSHSTRAVLSRN